MIAMARTEYSQKFEGITYVRGKANELPISPKHAIEIARFIRHKKVNDMIDYLDLVIAAKKAIPFRTFRRNIAHKKDLPGCPSGRYPKKAAIAYKTLLLHLKKNAEFSGVDQENLEIIHSSANRGRTIKAFFPRAMGRSSPKHKESVNIEIVAREVE